MSATKLRGRARQETSVSASESIGPTISHDDGSASGVSHTRNACKQDSRTLLKTSGSIAEPAARLGLGLARATSRPQAPLDTRGAENAARDLFDRAFRGIDERNRIAREERLGRAQLVGHLLTRRIAAFRAPFVTNLLKALGLDGQGIELATVRLETRGQLAGFEVVFGERIVRG